jgi:type IV pilus assembly protein PilA
MRERRRAGAFSLVELLVVIIILAILMAVAVALYLRAVRDSQRQTCRTNMQSIAQACQAYKVRSKHVNVG